MMSRRPARPADASVARISAGGRVLSVFTALAESHLPRAFHIQRRKVRNHWDSLAAGDVSPEDSGELAANIINDGSPRMAHRLREAWYARHPYALDLLGHTGYAAQEVLTPAHAGVDSASEKWLTVSTPWAKLRPTWFSDEVSMVRSFWAGQVYRGKPPAAMMEMGNARLIGAGQRVSQILKLDGLASNAVSRGRNFRALARALVAQYGFATFRERLSEFCGPGPAAR